MSQGRASAARDRTELLEGLTWWGIGHGARHASLCVDGQNPTGAFDAYRKLGFKLAFEAEVWEARLQ